MLSIQKYALAKNSLSDEFYMDAYKIKFLIYLAFLVIWSYLAA